ncbi:hypothetical protein, partial [Palleronia sp.]|uniref:hypothetical protein n=1 Tax=Palleronia sp. TaxID=1940284 RepID=UPI0035C7943A
MTPAERLIVNSLVVFVCEDGPPGNGLVRVTPKGEVDRFALNRRNGGELAGACFSPDGNTL